MREYAPYYDSANSKWKILAKDDDGYWFNYIPDAGDKEKAMSTADALNNIPKH